MNKNSPNLWINNFPQKQGNAHKYDSGHALIYAAPEMTGASRLTATACARMGAGLVSVLSTMQTYDIYRSNLPAHIITRNDMDYSDNNVSARLYGSGGLPCKINFKKEIPTILDAEALKNLPDSLGSNYILTPHEGEFQKTFPDLQGTNAQKALKAAKAINAIIVLKGQETVIAAPNGQVVINAHASPHLATAGTGDVLAGMITGLVAQKMPPFDAACAAVWIHGEAGLIIGAGLVASDIEIVLPKIMNALLANSDSEKLGFL